MERERKKEMEFVDIFDKTNYFPLFVYVAGTLLVKILLIDNKQIWKLITNERKIIFVTFLKFKNWQWVIIKTLFIYNSIH